VTKNNVPASTALPQLEKILQESSKGRFKYVQMVKDWLKVLQHSEEGKGLTTAELIQLALEDITSGEVTPEEVAEKVKKVKDLPPPVNDEFAMPHHVFEHKEHNVKLPRED
jgi:vacuolar-type H+-ATPase subunit E/Vma4